jgi:protein-S-isoprenylcysteine O-methyltransferase Ste14
VSTLNALADGETTAGIVRGLGLFGPLSAVILVAVLRPPPPARIAAAILASAWTVAVLPAVNLLAVQQEWWSFHADGGTVAGLPVDLLLGWALIWGTLPALAAGRQPLAVTGCTLVWLDLVLMPLLQPVVRLGGRWLYGEALAVAAALLPALLLARWTERNQRLPVRALAQLALVGVLLLALPVAMLTPALPGGRALGVGVQILAVPLLLGVAAVREFAVLGHGTPLPYDPPRRLVTTGPYAYVRNPMQLSMTLAYLVLSALTRDARLLVAVVVVVTYSAGLAAWHEGAQLRRAHARDWDRYRAGVRPWLPRRRPWPGMPPARVYVAGTCGVCDQVGRWIRRRSPVALEVVAAEVHPAGLRRITYESLDGRDRAQGIAALARVLQHLSLGWAWLGWALLLPGVAPATQLVVDGLGFGPRDLPSTWVRVPRPFDASRPPRRRRSSRSRPKDAEQPHGRLRGRNAVQ